MGKRTDYTVTISHTSKELDTMELRLEMMMVTSEMDFPSSVRTSLMSTSDVIRELEEDLKTSPSFAMM